MVDSGSTLSLRALCCTRPLAPQTWALVSSAEQARLRFTLIRGLSWNDWDARPAWWWIAEYRALTELKMACALDMRGAVAP